MCQKLSFLNQLTHNITSDCSLNSPQNTSSEHVVYKYCFECQNKNKKTIFVHNLFWTFLGGFNEQSLVILWVKRFKNESFWHRFTCTLISQMCFFGTINYETKCEFTLNLKQWATHHMLSLIHGLIPIPNFNFSWMFQQPEHVCWFVCDIFIKGIY